MQPLITVWLRRRHSGRTSEIKNGKINRFSLSMLVRLAQRAGLRPGIKLQKAA
jgi:hypothetical protein